MSLPLNPLDWPGPSFLLFLTGCGTLLVLALRHFQREREGTDPPRMLFTDPYLLGYLRAGHDETVRLAVASLVDRGFLAVTDTGRVERLGLDASLLRRPIEQAVLAACGTSETLSAIGADARTRAATDDYKRQLEQTGLLPDREMLSARINRYLIALSAFWGVGILKLVVALSRGHHNVGILVMMLLAAPVVFAMVAFSRQTTKGHALLRDLKSIFGHLKDRRSSLAAGGATNELAMLAAVFGLQMVPAEVFPWVSSLRPAPATGTSGCGTSSLSSCGSSSGSSCGSSCGSGCGGCGS